MKNIILVIFLVFIVSNNIHAQPYESIFGKTSTSWNVYTDDSDVAFTPAYTDSLVVESDTIVYNKEYKKVYRYKLCREEQPQLYGYLREDTLLGRVWFRFHQYLNSTNDTLEKLIMDLSLPDSMVDTVFVLNGRKHMQNFGSPGVPTPDWYYTEIEGVGHSFGIDLNNSDSDKIYKQLLCMYKDGIMVYNNYLNNSNSFNNECYYDFLTSASCRPNYTNKKIESNIEIQPNPTQGQFTIRNMVEAERITLLNSIGAKIFSRTNSKSNQQINISNQPNGLYYLLIENVEVITTHKIIKN